MSNLLPEWCPPYSTTKIDTNTGEDVYCICKKRDYGELMVGCDGCDDWFHFECMKIPETYRNLVESFICPYCRVGITGPGSKGDGECPKSLWKKKCRLQDCYEPCESGSKYCSKEHGKEYMSRLLNKVKIKNDLNNRYANESDDKLLKDVYHATKNNVEKFKTFGSSSFIDSDIDRVDRHGEIYDKIINDDKYYKDLLTEKDNITNNQIEGLKKKVEELDKYLDWISSVNKLINGEDNTIEQEENVNDTIKTKKKKKKSQKRRSKKAICGYSLNLAKIPCNPEEFYNKYSEITTSTPDCNEIEGICIKLRCNKHSDWSTMTSDQYTRQIISLETHLKRLDLSISTRKRQLNINYFEHIMRS